MKKQKTIKGKLPEEIIAEVKERYKNRYIPENCEDSFLLARAVGMISYQRKSRNKKPVVVPSKDHDRRRKHEDARIQQIRQMRESGMKQREIAEQLKLSEKTISSICSHYNISAPWGWGPKPSVDAKGVEHAKQLRAEGKTWTEIGREFGVCSTTFKTAVWRADHGNE